MSQLLAEQLLARRLSPRDSELSLLAGVAHVQYLLACQQQQLVLNVTVLEVGVLSGSKTFSSVVLGIGPSASFTTSSVLCNAVLSTAPQLLFPPPCCVSSQQYFNA